jgi:putative PEP-CTERM system histidine kinase
MDAENSVLTAWSYGLAGLVYFVFALSLLQRGYLRAPREAGRVMLLAAVLCGSLWGFLLLAFLLSGQSVFLNAWYFADVLRYAAWFAFLLILLRGRNEERTASSLVWIMPISAAVLVAALTSHILALEDIGVAAEMRRLVLFSSMALPVMAMILLEQLFRNVSDDARWNIKPICLGLAAIFLFDLYLYSQAVLFSRVDGDTFSIRGAIHALVIPFLLLSTTRHNDWITRIQISRKAAFHSATLTIAGLYLVFISGVGYYVRYFGGEWGRALQLALIFLGLVLLVILALSGAVRARLKVFLGKHFFRYRYDYREEWLRFTQTLSAKNSPQEMGGQVIRGLADMLESPGGGLWMKNRGEAGYSQTARWNIGPCAVVEDENSELSIFLKGSGWVVNLEEYRSFPRRYGQLVLPSWLQEIPQAWLIVPLTVADEMIGFVVLARARARMDVNWEVNDLLKTAGRQAASFLAQMQATEALLEVRKFDAFNRMSAFVVHDLKNVVTQLSLMMKNAKRLHNNPEFQQDMLITVENSLDRMRQLMLQLREGATPPGTVVGVDLETIIRRIEAVARERGRKLDVVVVEPVLTRGHEERLERIIGHMVQNAFDATDAKDRVWLKLDRMSGQALIEVGDTGLGMTQEFVRDRLFKPFQTTKKAGMGIGAYESFQYVQELGGKITVESHVNQGTIVTMLLPLFEIQRQSDLQPLGAS